MAEIRVNATGALKLYDSDDSNFVGLQAGSISSNVTFTLPTADGSNGQVLTTNGSGALSFATASSADPSSADGDSLGTASAEWSDLYLADGGIIYFGNDQEITLTHAADDGLILKHVGTGDGKEPSLTFQAGDNDIAQDDVLGSIFFQAPDEGAGTDAILVAAGIEAVSEGDFSSSNNATKLSFKTAASEAASEKMSLSSAGLLTVTGGITMTGATPTLTIGDAGAEDTKIVFDGNAQDYYIALDDSTDDLIIGLGSTVGTTPIISMIDTGETKITSTNSAATTPTLNMHSTGNANGAYANIKFTTAGNTTGGYIKGLQSGGGDACDLVFTTNDSGTNTDCMRMTHDGDIGVGTGDPGTARFNVQKNSDQLYYGKNDSSGQFQVTYQGVISATNTTVASISDERLKKDIADFSGGLDVIKAMRPRTYKWKNPQYHNDKDDTQYGFVAQELLTISDAEKLNLVVVDDANTMMYENEKDLLTDGKANISGYQERDAIYVSAIKELEARVKTLEDA